MNYMLVNLLFSVVQLCLIFLASAVALGELLPERQSVPNNKEGKNKNEAGEGPNNNEPEQQTKNRKYINVIKQYDKSPYSKKKKNIWTEKVP